MTISPHSIRCRSPGAQSPRDSGCHSRMRVFKGIPFAAPPVDALRWAPPAPVVSWLGVRRSDNFGPACWWGNRPAKSPNAILYQQTEGQSEDCLYLNVWTSERAGRSADAKRPVLMLIYGGGDQLGAGSLPNYNGEGLAQQGPVVVTMNYQLGPLGFLAHPALSADRQIMSRVITQCLMQLPHCNGSKLTSPSSGEIRAT